LINNLDPLSQDVRGAKDAALPSGSNSFLEDLTRMLTEYSTSTKGEGYD
jgi:hypothetical protein